MILADCISGHFGGEHYADQAKSTGRPIRPRLPDEGPLRGPDVSHGRTSRRMCTTTGCTRRALPYAKVCIECDKGVK